MPAAPIPQSCLQARLVLIRHGESVLGREGRYAGHGDTPLTPAGQRQILALRPRFAPFRGDFIFSSDLRRCRETAELLAPGRVVRFSERLRELDFGAWEGLTAEECRRRDPDRFGRWMRSPQSTRPPGGESMDQLWSRVRTFATHLARRHAGRTLTLITHGGPIRALLAPDPTAFWKVSAPYGAFVEIRWGASPAAAVSPRRRCGEGR
jgi:broad specificity phosphatase PhoE